MLRTLAISVPEPSRVLAIAQAHAQKTTTADNLPTLRIRVVDSTATDIGGPRRWLSSSERPTGSSAAS
jgi:hypothetical protein